MIPERLKKGQIIGCYSPSASLVADQSRIDLFKKGVENIKCAGFGVKEGKCTHTNYHHMSANAKLRAEEIHELFLDKEVAAIFPTIGGHVASQVLKYIDVNLIKENPKIFLGFSDSSLLASYITEKTGLVTFHSGCDLTFGFGRLGSKENPMQKRGKFSVDDLWNALINGNFLNNRMTNWTTVITGESKGTLIGGNIKGIQALLGTPYEPDWRGKILYWEAMDQPHVIMQSFTHLVNAGIINKISGLIVGKISHLKDNFYKEKEEMKIVDFIKYLVGDTKIPIVVDADIGHDVENITVPNGLLVSLKVTNYKIELNLI